jgi:antitoxin component YwqK of YwqJK toxin-antitoxin module
MKTNCKALAMFGLAMLFSMCGVAATVVTNRVDQYLSDKSNEYECGELYICAGTTNRVGLWRAYHDNGRLAWQRHYVDGIPEGVCSTWYSNGMLEHAVGYSNGVYQGMMTLYDEDGTIAQLRPYANGRIDGVVSNWYQSALYTVKSYSNGIMHGLSALYYSNGAPDTLAHYNAGIPTGLVTQWHENGVLSAIQVHNRATGGLVRRWHDNGVLYSEAWYLNYKLCGPYRRCYTNGLLEKCGIVSNGIRFGEWIFCNMDGSTTSVKQYDMRVRRKRRLGHDR